MNKISSEVEAKIVEMWFQGFSRDEIASILTVGQGTVSAKLESLPPCLLPLRDLSKTLRKLNLLPNDSLKGVNLLQLLAEHGVTPEKIPAALGAIGKASIEAGYLPEKVIQASMKLADLESQCGKTYPEAVQVLEKVTQQLLERTKENSQLQVEIERKQAGTQQGS